MIAPMKTCSKCATPKQLVEFYKDKRAADGLKCQCKACHIAGSVQWRREHPEAARAIDARHYAKNTAGRNESSRAYKKRAWSRVYAKHREWVAAHRERFAELMELARRRWNAANPEAVLANHHRRRARLKGSGGRYSAEDIAVLYAEQHGRCANAHCSKSLANGFHRDHIEPIASGGTNDLTNIQLLCARCNTMKGARPMSWLLQRTEGHRAVNV